MLAVCVKETSKKYRPPYRFLRPSCIEQRGWMRSEFPSDQTCVCVCVIVFEIPGAGVFALRRRGRRARGGASRPAAHARRRSHRRHRRRRRLRRARRGVGGGAAPPRGGQPGGGDGGARGAAVSRADARRPRGRSAPVAGGGALRRPNQPWPLTLGRARTWQPRRRCLAH